MFNHRRHLISARALAIGAVSMLLFRPAIGQDGQSVLEQQRGAPAGSDRPVANGAPIVWPSFESAMAAAATSRRMILVDVYSPTCPWCRKIQKEVYTDPVLQQYVFNTFELGRIDISVDADTISFKNFQLSSAQLGAGFGATGTPTTIFLEPDGDYITRLPGYHELEDFLDVLRFIGSESFREMSFADYVQAKEE